MKILETPRLIIRQLTLDDAEFILELLNEPGWLRFIGDRGVKSLEDARNYLLKGPLDMYARLGFGLYLVALRESATSIGMCGLLKRDYLDDVDLGFALLRRFHGQGLAFEAASGIMRHARDNLSLSRVVATTRPDNDASGALLEKLGFHFERMLRVSNDTPELKFYGCAMQDELSA